MKIMANGKQIEAICVTENQTEINGETRPTIAIAVKGGLSEDDIKALACGVIDIDNGYKTYKGFTGLVDLELLLFRPSDADLVLDQTADLQKGLDTAKAELEAAKAQLAAEREQREIEKQQLAENREQLEIAKAALIGAQIELPGEIAQKLSIDTAKE